MSTAVANRPEPLTYTGLHALLEKQSDQIAKALPRHLTPERMIRLAMTTMRKESGLLQCTQASLLTAFMEACQLGLEVGGPLGQSYLVPFKSHSEGVTLCQLIIGYKGFIHLAERSGKVTHFSPAIVFENEDFGVERGSRLHLHHVPLFVKRGKPRLVYAYLRRTDGGEDFEVVPWDSDDPAEMGVVQMQQRYAKKARNGDRYGTWVDHLYAMALKTPIRRLSKRAPLSPELQLAAQVDEAREDEAADIDVRDDDEVAGFLGRKAPARVQADGSRLASRGQLERLSALSRGHSEGEFAALVEWASDGRTPDPAEMTREEADRLLRRLEVEAAASATEAGDDDDRLEREAIAGE